MRQHGGALGMVLLTLLLTLLALIPPLRTAARAASEPRVLLALFLPGRDAPAAMAAAEAVPLRRVAGLGWLLVPTRLESVRRLEGHGALVLALPSAPARLAGCAGSTGPSISTPPKGLGRLRPTGRH